MEKHPTFKLEIHRSEVRELLLTLRRSIEGLINAETVTKRKRNMEASSKAMTLADYQMRREKFQQLYSAIQSADKSEP